MKRLLMFLLCLLILLCTTTTKSFAKAHEIVELKDAKGTLLNGVRIIVVAALPDRGCGSPGFNENECLAEPAGTVLCVNEINGVPSTNCYSGHIPPNVVGGKELSGNLREGFYIVDIPEEDLAQYGINKIGKYPIKIGFGYESPTNLFEGSFEIVEYVPPPEPVIETGPTSEGCISCVNLCCIEKAGTSFTKGLCAADVEALCRENCLASCSVDESNSPPIILADTSSIELLTEDLSDLQDDILGESEDSKIRVLRSIARKIDRVVRSLEDAVENADDGEPDSCNDDLQSAERNLERVISRLESKSCAEKRTKRCIPEDIADDFVLDLEDILDELDVEISIDDNEDDIADVCGST